ncbi:MAG: hypothetical protein M1827_000174 [Pycnora praestabilis]|nr:MAG: hypothetical protein M1827_000174 [Pycnora praestabilis]
MSQCYLERDSSSSEGKYVSPISPEDYGGLQRDLRRELDTYKTLVSSSYVRRLPEDIKLARASTTAVSEPESMCEPPKPIHNEYASPPKEKKRAICGLRRTTSCIVLITVITVMVAAISGGVIGGVMLGKSSKSQGQSSHQNSTTPSPNSSTPNATLAQLSNKDPMPGTSIATVAFRSQGAPNDQSFRVYYQEYDGTIQEVQYNGPSRGWDQSHPILTDARNYTGLAAMAWLNATDQTTSIFYVDQNNAIYEKRHSTNNPANNVIWEGGSISIIDSLLVNTTSVSASDNGPLQVAAAYSADFSTGPGARLYYHSRGDGPTNWVQELIWDQNRDIWSVGAEITGPVSTSQLAATIQGDALRLFYCSGDGTLEESWMNISAPGNATYTKGISQASVLAADDSPITAITISNLTTLLYYQSPNGIHELNLTSSSSSLDAYSYSNPTIIASPNTTIETFGSVAGNVPGQQQAIHLFYVAPGDKNAATVIQDTSRLADDPTWPAEPAGTALPLLNGYAGVSY